MQTQQTAMAQNAYGPSMQMRVLGPMEVVGDSGPLNLGGPKQRTVLALLAASVGRRVSVGSLIGGLYGDDAARGAKRTIHTYVSNLRRELGEIVNRSGDGYVLDIEPTAIDAVRFEREFTEGAKLVASEPDRAAAVLRSGLELWHGHAYDGVEIRSALQAEIARLDELRLGALDARIQADLALGAHRELVGELAALVAEYPLRESLRAHHMLALYRSGRQSEALRAFTRARDELGEELGIEPSPDLQKLEQRILDQDPALDLVPAVSIERHAIVAVELDEAARVGGGVDELLDRRNAGLANAAQVAAGRVLDIRGTAIYAVFPTIGSAIEAARLIVDASNQVAVDFGDIEVGDSAGSGPVVTRSLRLAAVANPGQVLISEDAQAGLAGEGVGGWSVTALGPQSVRGLDRPLQVFQLVGQGLEESFPALRLDRLPPPLPGTSDSVPGYELREKLGGDVWGTVHRAYQPALGREVVVRVIRPELVGDPRFVRRFEAVARQIASVEHPHVVPLLDYWREPGHAFLVYRLIDRAAPLAPNSAGRGDAMDTVRDIGAALAAGHDRGLPHGRMQPSNVLIDGSGHAYVADVGLAAMFDGMVQTGVTAHTAPEHIHSGASITGDVYALAVMAAEMLSGVPVPIDGALPSTGDVGADRVISRALSDRPGHRHASIREFLSELDSTARDEPAVEATVGRSERRNPFKGLLAFGEADAADFFGRTDLVSRLGEVVASQPFTLVVGPSGVGKSSLVRAGLIPRLRGDGREQGWIVTDMLPGARPFDALELALTRVARRPPGDQVEGLRSGTKSLDEACRELVGGDRLLIIVDQFEELFTHTVAELERRRFLDMVAGIAKQQPGSLRVVATIRADFLDQPLLHADFGSVVDAAAVAVAVPGRDEVREIIVGPCQRVGVEADGALAEAIVADVGEEPGALPLLQHALSELFEQRSSDRLTMADYDAVGGLLGSIGRRAESVFAGLSAEDQEAVRDLFLHLVTIGVDEEPVRRRIRLTEPEQTSNYGVTERIIDAFGRHRLIVFDRDPVTRVPTVEVAHEALLARWGRLATWIDESREDLLVGRRLEVTAGEWDAAEREESFLLTGAQLARASQWHRESGLPTNRSVAELIDASEGAAATRATERRRRRRLIMGGFAAAALLSTSLGIAAWVQRGDARDAAAVAAEEAALAANARTQADAEVLAAESELNQALDPDLSLLLAIEAVELSQTSGSVSGRIRGALQSALASHSIINRHSGGFHVEQVPGTNTYLTAADEYLARWDAASGEMLEEIAGPEGRVLFEAIVPESGQDWFVAVEGDNADTIQAYDPTAGSWSPLPGTEGQGSFAVDPSGRTYAFASGDNLEVWDRRSGEPVWSGEAAWFDVPSLSSDGRLAYAIREPGIGLQSDLQDDPDREFSVEIIDLASGEPIQRISGLAGDAAFLSFSPDGRSLLVSSWTFQMLFNLSEGFELTADDRVWARSDIARAWRPDWLAGGDLIGVGGLGAYSLLDPATGATEREIFGHLGGALEGALLPDLNAIVTAGTDDQSTLVHDLGVRFAIGAFDLPAPLPVSMTVTDDGGSMIVQYPNEYHILEMTTGQVERSIEGTWVFPVSSRGGAFVASTSERDGENRMVASATGEVVYTAPDGWHVRGISRDGDRLVLRDSDGLRTRLLHRASGLEVELDAGEEWNHAIFTDDGRYVLTGYEEILWDANDGRRVTSSDEVLAFWAEFSHDGELLVAGGGFGELQAFEVSTLTAGGSFQDALRYSVPAHNTTIVRVVISPDDRLVATSAWDEPVRIWDLETGELVWEFGDSDRNAVAFHPAGDLIYVADADGVSLHSLDLDHVLAAARDRATRNLTDLECETYLGRVCDV